MIITAFVALLCAIGVHATALAVYIATLVPLSIAILYGRRILRSNRLIVSIPLLVCLCFPCYLASYGPLQLVYYSALSYVDTPQEVVTYNRWVKRGNMLFYPVLNLPLGHGKINELRWAYINAWSGYWDYLFLDDKDAAQEDE